jgi:hypothetical protein
VSLIPSNAISSGVLTDGTWKYEHDLGTPGTAVPTFTYPALDGTAGRHEVVFTGNGGARYSQHFGVDSASDHWIYDVQVMFANPLTVNDLELDINQVLTDGATNIYAIQCSHGSGTWEWTSPVPHWNVGTIPCDPHNFTPNVWHHIQLGSSRDPITEIVTYDWVAIDGVQTMWGQSGLANEQLGWTPIGDLVLNFQIDGNGAGDAVVYEQNLIIWRW